MPVRAALAMLLLGTVHTHAAIVVPGATGADGPLTVPVNTNLEINLATSGSYDATQWAVVFRYTSVTINTGATVTFKNHPSGAPVIWLVGTGGAGSGDVTINGTVNLDGANGANPPARAEPGPGGFAGGMGLFSNIAPTSGFGPGGGAVNSSGSYGTKASAVTAREAYGNASLLPLIGGSGGGGHPIVGFGGGAGGGSILIAATGNISINGQITSKGGNSINAAGYNSAAGSGGGIRLVADGIGGTGSVIAPGGTGGDTSGVGRIRFERVTMNVNMNVSNQVAPQPSVLELASGTSAVIFPPSGSPTAKVLTVGGQAVPNFPAGSFGNVPADVKLAQSALGAGNTTVVVIETDNVSDTSDVFLLAQPRAAFTGTMQYTAARDAAYVDPTKDRWNVTVPVAVGYAALQVRVVRR